MATDPTASPFDRPPWYFADLDMRVESPRLVEIVRHWNSLRTGDAPPAATRFDPLDLVPHLGDLFIVRVEPGAAGGHPALRYSLIGTRLVEVLGRDATGLLVQDTFPADHPVRDVYAWILKHRAPARTHGRLDWIGKSHRSFESVLLPLVGPDGTIVKVVGAAVYRLYDGSIVGGGAAA